MQPEQLTDRKQVLELADKLFLVILGDPLTYFSAGTPALEMYKMAVESAGLIVAFRGRYRGV